MSVTKTPPQPKQYVALYMPEDMLEWCQEMASNEGVSTSQLVSRLAMEYVDSNEDTLFSKAKKKFNCYFRSTTLRSLRSFAQSNNLSLNELVNRAIRWSKDQNEPKLR